MFANRRDNPKVRERERLRAKEPYRVAAARALADRFNAKNPTAYTAHNILHAAVRDKKVVREPCAICASRFWVHAHHRDYAKPLDVVWLCARCHHRVHALFPELEGLHKA